MSGLSPMLFGHLMQRDDARPGVGWRISGAITAFGIYVAAVLEMLLPQYPNQVAVDPIPFLWPAAIVLIAALAAPSAKFIPVVVGASIIAPFFSGDPLFALVLQKNLVFILCPLAHLLFLEAGERFCRR